MAPQARWVHVGKRGFSEDSTGRRHQRAAGQARARPASASCGSRAATRACSAGFEEELEALARAGICLRSGARRDRSARRRRRQPAPTDAPRHRPQREPEHRDDAHRGLRHRTARTADTEVFYMAGKQLAALSRRLLATPAGRPIRRCASCRAPAGPISWQSDHTRGHAGRSAALLHAGGPSGRHRGPGARPVAAPSMDDVARRFDQINAMAQCQGRCPKTPLRRY